MTFDHLFSLFQIAVSIGGGIVVAWYWNQRNDRRAQFQYLDELYWRLLDAYRAAPDFGDKAQTEHFESCFSGDKARAYHCFAMSVHSAMESIFDSFDGKIPTEWISVFNYHSALHAPWLRANPHANEPGYVKRVLGTTD